MFLPVSGTSPGWKPAAGSAAGPPHSSTSSDFLTVFVVVVVVVVSVVVLVVAVFRLPGSFLGGPVVVVDLLAPGLAHF